VTGDGKADAIVVNNGGVTVRRSDGKQFLPNESWTEPGYAGNGGHGSLVQGSEGKVYLIQGNQRRWIPDPETFNAIGLNWGAIQNISDTDLNGIPLGNPLPSRKNGALVTGSDGKVYWMENGQRRHVPNPETFNAMGLNVGAIQNVSDADLNAIPLGNPLPAVQPPSTWQNPGLQFSTVTNKATGKALDAGGSNNSVYPHPLPNAGNEFHQWGFQKVGDYYMIINKATRKALDAGGSNSTLPYIHHDPNTQNPFHLWNLQQVGDAYMIINKATGKALDSGGDSGNQIYMHPTPMPSNPFHLWKLNLPDGGNSGSGGGGTNPNAEAFFGAAKGKVGITRLDGNYDLRGQCVTLIARYVQEVFLPANQRTIPRAFGHGKDTARVVSQMLPNSFEAATSSGLPKRGAIISFPDIGIVNGVRYGHVAIVMESRQLSNGQRQVRIMDSNGDGLATNSTVREYTYWINIPNGTANGYGANIYWTNPK
ncbi:RICIN domain-containing protein, partial [Microcoleus sp. AT8-B1]